MKLPSHMKTQQLGTGTPDIDKFDEDTRVSTMQRRAKIIKRTEFKLECYAEFLTERKEHIEAQIKQAKKTLANKLATAAAKVAGK